MLLNDFGHKHKLKIKTKSITKTYQVLSSLSLNDAEI